ncbi:MAG: glycosyltransferase family 4 protein [Candidatus Bathyarchaeota archaeon]|nr:glycosyltransferase family 4 protein [Candidatus Bathyarchaeota archaeon]
MKIAYANDGVSEYDAFFLNSLSQKYDVSLLTFHSGPDRVPPNVKIVEMRDFIPETGLHPFEGIRKHALTLFRARTLAKTLRSISPDVLIGNWASTYGFYSAQSNFHPFILFVWGSDVLIFPRKYFPLKPLIASAIAKADAIVVDSNIQEEATVHLGGDIHKILKFPWIDSDAFNAVPSTLLREQWGWSENDIVVVCARHHKPIYGIAHLVEAIPRILRKEPETKFLFIGEGPLTSTFKQRLRRFIDNGNVKFVGKIPHEEMPEHLSAGNIYVSPSFSDGTSATLLEAMKCGLTPVVTEIPGNKEWISHGVNGLLVPVANSKKLAAQILRLARNRQLMERLQKNAKQTIRRRVDWQKNFGKLSRLIEHLGS